VASPASCPSGTKGSASGRHSPWVGHVDVSVFLATKRPRAVKALGDQLRRSDDVAQVYFESAADAYAEFQRLYTCSAAVPRSAVPASYRLVLRGVTHSERDALVRRIVRMPGVRDVACDPSDPCVSAATS
jgi:cell division protein FtsX